VSGVISHRVPLGEVALINPRAVRLDPEQQCAFIPMEAVDDLSGKVLGIQVRRVAEVQKGYTFFAENDVLFAKITPCMENGKAAIARGLKNGVGYGSTEFHVLRASGETIPEWIFYFLRKQSTLDLAANRMTGSAGQRRVPSSFLDEVFIPLPPLAQQKQIARRLEQADRLRRLRAYALEVSDRYLQGMFLEMFGDPETNPKGWDLSLIEDVISKTQYGTSDKSNQERRGHPLVGMSNLTYSGRIDIQKYSFVELSNTEFEVLKLKKGDVLFNRTNSTEMVGKTAVWKDDLQAVAASYLVKLEVNQDLNPEYFSQLLNMPYFKELFIQRCKRAVSQSNISPTLLKEFTIAVPPIDLQNGFAAVVQKHERLRGMQVEALRQAEVLYSTLLEQAFGDALGAIPR
jgi:type I restriction enzyme, S subunit